MRSMIIKYQKYFLCLLTLIVGTKLCAQNSEDLDSVINSLSLQEVIVTAKKIRQSGDTISYSASTYRDKNDKTLEDLLRKMPGIEVKSDGKITFNGQWINEFYIEGMDMLGSNYGVATRNIDANDIGTVQVMQNHQDIKMLQGIQSGTAPAMNIKLKQSALGIWSSTIQTSLGTQPNLSWDLSANLMNFRRKAQNISVLKTNNVGNDLRQDIGAPVTFNSSYGTGILFPDSPGLNDIYTYRNTSGCLSINQLFKLDEDKTFSFNLNYLYDKEKRDASEQTTYLTDSISRFIIDESNKVKMQQQFIGAHAVYKLNGKKHYLKNSFTAGISFPNGEGTINDLIHQHFTGHSLKIDDELKINYKTMHGAVGEAIIKANFTDKPCTLILPELGLSQAVRQRNVNAVGLASLVSVAVPHFMFNLNGGFDIQWQQAKTEMKMIDILSSGDQHTWQAVANITPKFFFHNGQKFQWLINIPLGVEYYRSKEGSLDYSKVFFTFKPYTNITYKPSERWALSLTSLSEESIPSSLSLMAQIRYIDYRTLAWNPLQLEAKINRTVKTSLNVSYTSVLDMIFGGVTLTHAYSHNGLSNGYEVSDEIIEYTLLPNTTRGNIWQGDQTFSKGFFKWNSKVSESFSIGTSKNEFYVDDVMQTGRSNYLRFNISYNASFTRWLTFSTSNEFALSKTFTNGKSNGRAKHTFSNSTSFIVRPYKSLTLAPAVMYYYNDYSTDYRNNVFMNCDIEYSFNDFILFLKGRNLLDSKIFRRYNDNGIIQYSSEYRLRGRTIMVGVRFSIK
ncbi:MAG: Plug domain-containing protein [Muribaculaceae bacterium]|nr:Plug domain-containing protein [Muribaculaceae bacterium]